MKKALPQFGLKDKIGYALGDLGGHLTFAFVSTYLLLFYTQYMGIDPAVYGAFILALKLWEGLNDPLIGALIDKKSAGKSNRYKPWIQKAMWGLSIGFVLIFLPLKDSPLLLRYILMVGTYLTWDICYTFVNVPYCAMNSSISEHSNDRTALSAWRNIGDMIAGALVMLVPLFAYDKDDNLLGDRFVWMALIIGGVQLITSLLLLNLTTERTVINETAEKAQYKDVMRITSRTKPVRPVGQR